jgi:putative transcriptional regulator
VVPGQLLVATDQLRDADFGKSVILVVAADARGVQGIWINRPTTVAASVVFPGLKSDAEVFQGGPLRIGINGLVRAARQPEGGARLFGDVWLVADQPALRKLAAADANVRIYVGTCGWSVAQLDDETRRRGAWTILPATAGAVFDAQPRTLWDRLAHSNFARSGDRSDSIYVSFPKPSPRGRSRSFPSDLFGIPSAARAVPELP